MIFASCHFTPSFTCTSPDVPLGYETLPVTPGQLQEAQCRELLITTDVSASAGLARAPSGPLSGIPSQGSPLYLHLAPLWPMGALLAQHLPV